MATINLGRVAYVNRGAYDSTMSYEKHDVVTFNNGSYVFVGDMSASGKEPTDNAYWMSMLDPTSMNAATEAAEALIANIQNELNQKAPAIPVDASGDMVQITDGAEMPVKKLITNIEPKADGSGWDSVSATRTGKNLANLFDFSHTQSTVVTTAKDGIVTINGTATSSNSTSILLWKSTLKPGTYTLSHKVLSGSMINAAEAASVLMGGGARTRMNAPAATITIEEEQEVNFSIMRASSTITYDNFTFSVQLECGDTTTDFEPPNMQTISADLPEAVTEGEYDWLNGMLTKADGSTVQLEKQTLSTLYGVNNIWSDAGETVVTYIADTKAYIEQNGGSGGSEGTGEDGGYYIPAVDDSGLLTWSASKTGMQAVASANIKGPKGDTPVKGTDYFDGEDGESVTVKSVSESTEDGGSNVVTFSDGKTLTVKNGSKGSKGDTPVKGTDYYTADDKTEMVGQVKAAMPTLTLTGVDADGVTHTYTIYGS